MAGKMGQLKIEQVFEETGGYGFYQKIFTFAAIYPQITAAMIILSPVFTSTHKVPIFCSPSNDFCDSLNCTSIVTVTSSDLPVFSSIVQEWNLVCSQSWMVEIITSFQMMGMMSGALLSSLISDSFGRKKSFLFVTLGMGIFGTLPSLTFNPIMYTITRFLAGLGMGGCFVVLLCHLMEMLTPKYRVIVGSLSLWPFGEIFLGFFAYLIPNWRYLTIVTALPVFLVFLLFPFIQESPRWLLTQRRTKEAYDVMCKIAKFNSKPPPLYRTIETLQVNILKEEEQVLKGIKGIKEIIKSKDLRKHLAILTWGNVTCAMVYYGVSFNAKSLSGSPFLNMLYMGVLDLFAKPSILLFNYKFGRKVTFFITMTFASLFLLTLLILNFAIGFANLPPNVVTAVSLLGRFGVLASWGSLSCIILESFPTTLRATCLGIAVFSGYLGGIAAPSLPLLDSVLQGCPYILYSFLAITSAISSLFLRDMTGVPLKDTVES